MSEHHDYPREVIHRGAMEVRVIEALIRTGMLLPFDAGNKGNRAPAPINRIFCDLKMGFMMDRMVLLDHPTDNCYLCLHGFQTAHTIYRFMRGDTKVRFFTESETPMDVPYRDLSDDEREHFDRAKIPTDTITISSKDWNDSTGNPLAIRIREFFNLPRTLPSRDELRQKAKLEYGK